MVQEVELKLELAPEAADAIEASGLLVGNLEPMRQHSINFDTPKQRLSKADLRYESAARQEAYSDRKGKRRQRS
ncbi:hypothetical protein EAH79_05785 [Sphingomonas koreensis]|nr:hypothetical protein EAH79_05785 [Sphingomonas koreensis]